MQEVWTQVRLGAVWSGMQIRRLLLEQSDQGPHYLPLCKNRFEKFAWIFSRWHKQTTSSDAGFLGILRVITKTCLYSFDPLKPHFYIVKLGFTGYTLFYSLLLKNIDCGYSLELPHWGGSNEFPQSMFWAEIWKISEDFYLKIFSFWR